MTVPGRSFAIGSYSRLQIADQDARRRLFAPLVRYAFAFIYAAVMVYSYRQLSPWWSYLGFEYRPVGLMLAPILCIAALPALILPKRIGSLSQFAAWILFYLLFLPAMVIPQLQGWMSAMAAARLFLTLVASTFLFILLTRGQARPFPLMRFDGRLFWVGVLAIWAVIHVGIVLYFGATLSIAGFEDVYEQRSTAAMVLGSGSLTYVLSNAASALNPFLVAAGIADRKWWLIPIGVVGQLIVYSSLAGKIVLVFPVVIAASFLLFDRNRRPQPMRIGMALVGVGLLGVPLLATYVPTGGSVNSVVELVYFRTLYLPGVLVGVYNEFFSIYPVTYFSHSIVGRLFTEYPYGIWSVGQVVGSFVTPTLRYDNINNYNANFIAADGIAGFGILGIPFVVMLVALMLKLIDKIVGAVDLRIRCAAFVPLLMWLADGSLFTALLTGGGVATTLLVWLWGGTRLAPPQ